MTGRGRKRIGRPIIDVAICLQIMYDITDEELDEWGTTSERAKRKRWARSSNGSKPKPTVNGNAPKKVCVKDTTDSMPTRGQSNTVRTCSWTIRRNTGNR